MVDVPASGYKSALICIGSCWPGCRGGLGVRSWDHRPCELRWGVGVGSLSLGSPFSEVGHNS